MSEHVYRITSGNSSTYNLNTYGATLFDVRVSQVGFYSKEAFKSLSDLFKQMVMYDNKMEQLCSESLEHLDILSTFYTLPHKILVELLFLCSELSADMAMNIVSKIIAYQVANAESIGAIFNDF